MPIAVKFKKSLGTMGSALNWTSMKAGDVLAINIHRASVRELAAMIGRLSERYHFASHQEVLQAQQPPENRGRPTLILTFDDGFACHLPIAEFLAQQGIGATFFVVPQFTQAECPLDFAASQIVRPTREWTDSDLAELEPLSRSEIAQISAMGHAIGSHTMTHTIYPGMHERELYREIVDSRKWLEDVTQTPINAFAGPFTSDLLDRKALHLIEATYEWNFVTFPSPSYDRYSGLVWRSNIEPRWPVALQEYVLRFQSFEARRYRSRRERLISDWRREPSERIL